MAEKNGFDITKLIFQNMCVCVCVALHLQRNWVRLSATLFSVSLYRFLFFFLFSLCFLVLTADPADHTLGSIYILSFSPGYILEKGLN